MTVPELIIFDCDGVLINSEPLSCHALVNTLAELGISVTLDDVVNTYVGISSASMMALIEEKYHIKLPADFLQKKRQHTRALYKEELQAIPGIFEFIDVLPTKKCVGSSSSMEGLRNSLGMVGLWDRFAPHIFSAEQVKHGKPAPDLFLFAADQMGVLPSACLVIEDSVAGVRAAKAANMRVFGFTGGGHCGAGHADRLRHEGAEQVFAHMKDLRKALL
jgi:HAD superfamily hydrolase (TIGR01509 family)